MEHRSDSRRRLRPLWLRLGAFAAAAVFAVLAALPVYALPDDTGEDTPAAAAYEDEKAERLAEYQNKFNMTTLLWNTKGTDANGNEVNYGNSARNYLYWADGNFGGVEYKNYIHVFAFEGDTICFGSDVFNSTLNADGTANATDEQKAEYEKLLGDDATVDIVLTDLRGNRILYDVKEGGAGHIPDVQTEVLAKTMEDKTGNDAGKLKAAFPDITVGSGLDSYKYTPLTYQVTETGVYTLEFHSYAYTRDVGNHRIGQTTKNDAVNSASGAPAENIKSNFYRPDKTTAGDWKEEGDYDAHSALVAAWDVSVFNEQGQKETGRVYADYLSLQQNGGYDVHETYYVVTTDSYIYRWDWLGNRPNTYNFFADNKGLTDNATGSTLYKSVKELTNANFDYTRFGASFKYPGSANTDESKSYYIFFEMPNPDLEGRLYTKAIQPDPAENIRFVDTIKDPATGYQVPGAYEGLGGYFAFDTKEATTATLVLRFDKINDGGDPSKTYAPVTISGPVKPYDTNYFYWDGRDGNGEIIPAGNYKIEDLVELTTKAGEIHFPVHDMEYAPGGFTFTRVSPIYDREGNPLDGPDTILDATKSVIYYDDTAIYYGEKVGSTGLTEAGVRPESTSETRSLRDLYQGNVVNDGTGKTYFRYNNMRSNDGGEYLVRQACENYVGGVTAWDTGTSVAQKDFIRIGDHSHTTNMINYYDGEGHFLTTDSDAYTAQSDKITYLDSKVHPVAKIPTSATYGDTTDYGIADFWTFIPAQPAVVKDSEQTIEIINGTAFNLTGQVFYDHDVPNGTYDSMKDSDTLLAGVTLNLYRQTDDVNYDPAKTYYTMGTAAGKVNGKDTGSATPSVVQRFTGTSFAGGQIYYELFKTDVTPVSGRYFFTNVPYKDTGTAFVYEVVRPDASYTLTSGNTKAKVHTSATGSSAAQGESGAYALYAYDTDGYGTEVQTLTVGTQTGQVNPDSKPEPENTNHTVTAVDVGYHYTLTKKLTLKKTWPDGAASHPEPAVFEVCYVDNAGVSHVYEERPLTQIDKMEHTYELLPAEMDGTEVKDWYVAAEYYIDKVGENYYIFRHSFAYDRTTGTYTSFVGDSQYIRLEDLNGDNVYDRKDIPHEDGPEKRDGDWSDLPYIQGWQTGAVTAPYHAVLDRNPGTAETTVNITNAVAPGVIEILKYTGTPEDHNYLQGATFRLYEQKAEDDMVGTAFLAEVEKNVAASTTGEETARADAFAWLDEHQAGSSSTRANGKVVFAGLDPTKHYVLRETFAPTGYRAMETLYLVHPKESCTCGDGIVALRGNAQGAISDEEWETLTRQNFYFGQTEAGNGDYVQAAIANIPVNGDMAVRKQIDGRAWGGGDSFTFDIAFRDSKGALVSTDSGIEADSVNLDGAVVIDETEYGIVTAGGAGATFADTLRNFIKAFNEKTDDITVNNSSEQAKNIITLADKQELEETLPDIKQSVSLVVNAEIKRDDATGEIVPDQAPPDDACLNTDTVSDGAPAQVSHFFPAAGTYTFTVSENALDGGTLSGSARVYTLVVKVERLRDPNTAEGALLTVGNSYLRAEVQNIYYQDPTTDATDATGYPANYGSRRSYAGVAPTFTNTYHIQPAIQTTSYAITKSFTGRRNDDGTLINSEDNAEGDESTLYNDGWEDSDNFTVTITGADPVTADALTAGNIYIGGLHGTRDGSGHFDTDKQILFNQLDVTNPKGTTTEVTGDKVDDGHTFRFEEIDFQNLEFPVKWVFKADVQLGEIEYKAGEAVPEKDESTNTNIVVYLEDGNQQELPAGSYFVQNPVTASASDYHPVEARTEDIVYKLEIRETVPAGDTKGIIYDDTVYTLVITLKNAASADAGAAGEATTDGIIDELDFKLYDCAAAEVDTPVDGEPRKPVATCETDQKVVDSFDAWANATFTEFGEDVGDTEDNKGWTNKWYYVNGSGTEGHPVIREAEPVDWTGGEAGSGMPTRFKVMVPQADSTDEREIYIVARQAEADGPDNYFAFDALKGSYDLTFIAKREGHTGDHMMTIDNVYKPTGTWTPSVQKTLIGRAWEEGEEFTFTLECTAWPGMDNVAAKESASGDEGDVADEDEGDGGDTGGTAGEKNYTCNPLWKGGDTAPAPLTLDIEQSDADKEKAFEKIEFHAPGKYTFTLTEADDGKGVGKGSHEPAGPVTLTVTAEDNGEGVLNLTVWEGDDPLADPLAEPLDGPAQTVETTTAVTNTYTESGTFALRLSKTLEGRAWAADSFTFTVTPADTKTDDDVDNDTAAAITSGQLILPDTWTKDETGGYTFTVNNESQTREDDSATRLLDLGTLKVQDLGAETTTFTFTIAENTADFDTKGYACAQNELTLTITATADKDDDGKYTGTLLLTAGYTYTENGSLAGRSGIDLAEENPLELPFVNQTFAAGTISAYKTLGGRDWGTLETFTALVELTTDGDGDGKPDCEPANVALAEDHSQTFATFKDLTHDITLTKDDTKDDPATLPLVFLKAGVYTFTVTEQGPDPAASGANTEALLYDGSTYTVTFTVTEDANAGWTVVPGITKGGKQYDEDALVFTNSAPGALTVSKTVEDGETDETFTLRVNFTYPTQGTLPEGWKLGLPAGAVNVTGPGAGSNVETYTVRLQHGQDARFANIPAGTTYAVTEQGAVGGILVQGGNSYAVSITAGNGTIAAGEDVPAAAEVTNTLLAPATAELAVKKELDFPADVPAPGQEQTFSFTLRPTVPDLPGDPVSLVSSDGITKDITVDSSSGWENTIGNMLADYPYSQAGVYTYDLFESSAPDKAYIGSDASHYTVIVTVTASSDGLTPTVTVTGPANIPITGPVIFTNTYLTGSLTVTKTVTGTAATTADHNTDFNFSVTVAGVDGPLNGQYGDVNFDPDNPNTATFTLHHGQRKVISGLPAGATYTVTETDADKDGYTTSYRDESGVITGGRTVSGAIANGVARAAQFYNVKNAPQDTNLSDLIVTKTVVGSEDDVDPDAKFTFTVTLGDPEMGDPDVNGEYGEMYFTNGKAVFTLGAHESMTATRLPAGVSYLVQEDPGDYETTSTGAEGHLPDGGTAHAFFVNTFGEVEPPAPDVGTLSVTKTVAGATAEDANTAFTFTVTLTDGDNVPLEGLYGETEFDDTGTATFTLKDGERRDIPGLPAHTHYTVTETVPAGYGEPNYPDRPNSGYIEVGSTVTVAAVNHKLATPATSYAYLTVSKTVTGTAAEADKAFHFTITLGDNTFTGTSGGVSFNGGEGHFTLKHDESKVFVLPANAPFTYTVTEDDYSTEGYTTSPASRTVTGRLANQGTAYADFVNHRDAGHEYTGSLVVTKTVEGDTGEKERDFNFTVTLSDTTVDGRRGDMEFKNGVAAFTLHHDQSITALGLPGGTRYTVTETEADTEGYETTATGDTGIIPSDKTAAAASFINKRESKGSLVVTKTVTGAGDRARTFTFTVTLNDTSIHGRYGGMDFDKGKATFTLAHGHSIVAEGLPTNRLTGEALTYTVTEAEANADGYTTTSSGETGTITANNVATAAFVNHLPQGTLRVTKLVTGTPDAAALPPDGFHFTVHITKDGTSLTGEYGGLTFVNGDAAFTLQGGESRTLNGLPAGASYTVTETEANSGCTTTASGDTGEIAEDATVDALFVNTFAEPAPATGALAVTNEVRGNAADPNKEFRFTVTFPDEVTVAPVEDGGYVYASGAEDAVNPVTFTMKHGERMDFAGLPADTAYTVTETDYADEGYASSFPSSNDAGTIRAGDTVVVPCLNEKNVLPDDNTATLTVSKLVTGTAAETEKAFTFTVHMQQESGDLLIGEYSDLNFVDGNVTFELRHGQSKTITGLPAGTICTVTEDADGYTAAVEATQTTTAGGSSDIKDSVASGFTLAANSSTSVAFTNRKDAAPTGSLTVAKAVAGNDAETERAFTFRVALTGVSDTVVYGGVTFADGKATLLLKGGESQTVTGLPAGTAYTVTEDEAGKEGYTTTAIGDNGTIAAGTTARADFLNYRDKTARAGSGTLIVSKSVTGAAATADDRARDYTFTVTASAAGEPLEGTYGGMTFAGGTATFTLKDGASLLAENLPDGTVYKVEEDRAGLGGFTSTLSNAEGTVGAGAVVAVGCVNARNAPPAGSLTVSKTVTGNGGERERDFHFTVTMDTALSGRYGDVTFAEGKAEFTLRHGSSIHIEGLPVGASYTVAEDSYASAGYTTAVPDNASGVIPDGENVSLPFFNDRTVAVPVPAPEQPPEEESETGPEATPAPTGTAASTHGIRSPKTSDEHPLGPWRVLFALSGAGMIFTGILYGIRRRRRGKER